MGLFIVTCDDEILDVNIFLFDGFETLDIFYPIEVLGRIPEHNIVYYSELGGYGRSSQGAEEPAVYAYLLRRENRRLRQKERGRVV